ncbi:hypothetical protein PACTADRAFT_34523 [Pachysolen tannophilus NRRL Y-2460]|uniref:Uncharacterized protein n=1 Tax=Pachysolen tannophilus NRRL Y-2460 TaxID=669874 RepID=A0A1E4TSP0_PACTA|nr:hypothetical protein PACTADRAFT_34523 [Pachysolen tannophilus NRRL Y-2460]
MLYKSKFIHTRDNNETVEVDYVDLFDLQMANFSNKLENYIMIHLPNSIELIEIHKSLLNNYQGSYLNYLLSYFADDDILNTETFITNLEKFIFKPTRNILDRARIRQGNSTTIMVSSILDDNTPEYSNFDAPPPYTSAGNSDSRNSSCVQLPTGGLRTHYGRSTSMPQLCGVSSSSSPGSLFSKKWKRGNRNNNNNNNNR